MRERLRVFVTNIPAYLNAPLAWWLRRQGWVVFYLDPQARTCRPSFNGMMPNCWLALYEQSLRPKAQAPLRLHPDAFALTHAPRCHEYGESHAHVEARPAKGGLSRSQWEGPS